MVALDRPQQAFCRDQLALGGRKSPGERAGGAVGRDDRELQAGDGREVGPRARRSGRDQSEPGTHAVLWLRPDGPFATGPATRRFARLGGLRTSTASRPPPARPTPLGDSLAGAARRTRPTLALSRASGAAAALAATEAESMRRRRRRGSRRWSTSPSTRRHTTCSRASSPSSTATASCASRAARRSPASCRRTRTSAPTASTSSSAPTATRSTSG